MTWALTVLSIIGVILNIKHNKMCFVIWSFTNIIWAIVDFRAGIYAQAALFMVYFSLAIWGLVSWSKDKKAPDCSGAR